MPPDPCTATAGAVRARARTTAQPHPTRGCGWPFGFAVAHPLPGLGCRPWTSFQLAHRHQPPPLSKQKWGEPGKAWGVQSTPGGGRGRGAIAPGQGEGAPLPATCHRPPTGAHFLQLQRLSSPLARRGGGRRRQAQADEAPRRGAARPVGAPSYRAQPASPNRAQPDHIFLDP